MSGQISSPLRYPGGKTILANFFQSFMEENNIKDPIYVEPFCGGSGAAIELLLKGNVSEIWLNDASYSIYSFWLSMKEYGEEFIDTVSKTEVTLEEWRRQKAIFDSKSGKTAEKEDILSNGFATFFLNRCNRSGILNAGPIGGKTIESQNTANYKIDARFNKENLIKKLSAIVDKKDQINVTNLDALRLLKDLSQDKPRGFQRRCFVYLDPPYYKQGSSLYLNFYNHLDHKDISDFLSQELDWTWVLSYDNVGEIRILYKDFPLYSFYINYSAQESKLGSELLVHSRNSTLPKSLIIKEMKSNRRIQLEQIGTTG